MGKKRILVNYDKAPMLFHNGCACKETFKMLIECLGSDEYTHDTICNYFSPIVVNCALAAELFLKYLRVEERHERNCSLEVLETHSVSDLFKDLYIKNQIAIIIELKRYNCGMNEFCSFLMSKDKTHDVVLWRYLTDDVSEWPYELGTLMKLNEVLYEMCLTYINKRFKPGEEKSELPDLCFDVVPEEVLEEIELINSKKCRADDDVSELVSYVDNL